MGVVHDLSLLNMFRGTHSTGLLVGYTPDKGKDKGRLSWAFHKDTLAAFDFMAEDPVEKMLDQANKTIRCVVGHTRYATVGDINVENAHPHRHGNVIGCHNGTIEGFTWRVEDKAIGTDSKVLISKLANEGIIPALKQVRDGAYALTWTDLKTKKVYFVRNDERPLWFMETSDKKTVFWSSECRVLDFISHTGFYEKPIMLPPHELVTIDPLTMRIEREDLSEDIKWVKPAKNYPSWAGIIDRFEERNKTNTKHHSGGDSVKSIEEAILAQRGSSLDDKIFQPVIVQDDCFVVYTYRGYRGVPLTLKEAQQILSEGCSNCTEQKTVRDKVYWVDRESYVCSKCVDTDAFIERTVIPDMNDTGHMVVSRHEKGKHTCN